MTSSSATVSEPPQILKEIFRTTPLSDGGRVRPYVTLTFAQSLDAKIAGSGGRQLILSGMESMLMTHWMRTMHDAILIGIGTALNDDPQLNVRHLPPPPEGLPAYQLPQPVILDTDLRLPPTCKLLQRYQAGLGRLPWIFSASPDAGNPSRSDWLARKSALEAAGARVSATSKVNGMLSVPDVLQILRDDGIRSVMVEGGAAVITTFLETAASSQSMVDTLIVTIAPTLVGSQGVGYNNLNQIPDLQHIRTEIVGRDTVVAMKVTKSGST